MYCKLCGNIINEKNKSSEHIIHNAIGGILEDDTIYCRDCNSKYGTEQDKAFSDIFAPLMGELKIRRNRKTQGGIYQGIMYDRDGNLYHVEYKNGKVWTVRDDKGNYCGHKPRQDMFLSGVNFNFNSIAFKKGLAKIAFNYAIHNGINADDMNMIFEPQNRKLIDKLTIIPYLPMTHFDTFFEACLPKRLFHALRIFNNNSCLYVYIELFATFQFYILISDTYKHNHIDNYYCNYIENNELPNEGLRKDLTPYDFKDADIILEQYNLDIEDIQQSVCKMSEYKNGDHGANWTLICKEIGNRAYEVVRKSKYERDYRDVVNRIYNETQIADIAIKKLMDCNYKIDELDEFIQSFQYYTCYEEDCVNISKYKHILPDGTGYPEAIHNIFNKDLNDINVSIYIKSKVKLLEERMGVKLFLNFK